MAEKKKRSHPKKLRLQKRTLMVLDSEKMAEIAGGHTCNPTCNDASCARTLCGEDTCAYSCFQSDCGPCDTDECQTLPYHGCG